MASNKPFEQLRGPVTVYVAPAVEAPPVVDVAPAGNWVALGATDEDVILTYGQSLVYFSDNDHTEDVAAARESEMLEVTMQVVGLTHVNFATLLHDDAKISVDAGPPATSQVPFLRGFDIYEYSLLLVGSADSPFGNFPAFRYIPRAVIAGEPAEARSKSGRPALEVMFHALSDDTQAAGDELGWTVAQTA